MKAKSANAADLRALLERQGKRCALTGRELTPRNCVPDHITPVAGGGTGSIDNIQIVLSVVNRAKQTMSNEEFIAMCRDVVRHAELKVFDESKAS